MLENCLKKIVMVEKFLVGKYVGVEDFYGW